MIVRRRNVTAPVFRRSVWGCGVALVERGAPGLWIVRSGVVVLHWWNIARPVFGRFGPGRRWPSPVQECSPMPWLLRDGRVLASLEVATSRRDRRRGLLGKDGFEGALLIDHARSVHTIGMRFPIDVAHLDGDHVVLRTCTMSRNRLGLPVWHAHCVLEAEAGSFARWGLEAGQELEVRTSPPHEVDDPS